MPTYSTLGRHRHAPNQRHTDGQSIETVSGNSNAPAGVRPSDWQGNTLNEHSKNSDPILSPLMVQSLFRITQEAVNNALKYANATTIGVSLTRQDKGICLIITDNGVGFDTTRTASGYGLTNMQRTSQ